MSEWLDRSGQEPGQAGAQHEGGVPAGRRLHRRRFLGGAVAGASAVALGSAVLDASTSTSAGASQRARHAPVGREVVRQERLPGGARVPVAAWLVAENAKPGTTDWVVTGVQTPGALEGYADQVSALPGQEITLYVHTAAQSVHVEAYRMGYYQGLGGRLVARTDTVAGTQQPPATFTPGVNTVECHWAPSLSLRIGRAWPPGAYLLKLVGDAGQQQYIPFCVRDDQSTAAFVFQNSVTTWQAYNLWGGYSLYLGLTPGNGEAFSNRSRVVSFDRPYPQTWAQGSADFLGNEFPVLFQMERYGIDLTYWTDVDLHTRPQLLANHRCLLSLGHDEYWSRPMRDGAQGALDGGTNLAFLGANACYRQIRMEASPLGPNRRQVCYKDAAEDPMSTQDPALVTVDWASPPLNDPESTLIGSMYQSIGSDADLVVTDASSWWWAGTGVTDGQHLPAVVQGEFDRYVPSFPGPTNVDILAHSMITNIGETNWSDITYYTVAGGGGVLASGDASFVNKLSDTTAFPTNVVPVAIPGVTDILLGAMENLYGRFGNGPASQIAESTGNWTATYPAGQGTTSQIGSTAA